MHDINPVNPSIIRILLNRMPKPSKEQLEYLKLITGNLKSIVGIIWTAILVVGGLITVAYCWMEGFFPDGLTFGDAYLLASTCFALFVLGFVGLGYGAYSTLWIVRSLVAIRNWRRRRKGEAPDTALHTNFDGKFTILTSFLVWLPFAWLLVRADGAPDMRVHGTLGYFMLSGFLLLLFFGVRSSSNRPLSRRFRISLIATLLGSSLVISPPALLNMTMGTLGIRSLPNQLVTMSDADHIQLAQIARLNNLKVSFCKLPDTNQWGSLDVRAIWYDLGNTSFVRIYDSSPAGLRSLVVPLDRKTVEVIRGENVRFKCAASNVPS